MVSIGIGVLALVVIVVAAIYLTLKVVKPLIINSVLGVVALLLVNFVLPVEVEIALIPVLIVAVGGLPGLLLVVLLAFFEIAFHAPGAATVNAGLLIGHGA